MAKKVVSGGGGGSVGKSVSWHDSIVAELRGPEIPPDAIWAAMLAKTHGEKLRLSKLLAEKEAAGELQSARGIRNGRSVLLYWPASK